MIYDDYDVTTTAPFESTGSPDCDLFYLDCDSPNLETLWAALYLDKGMFSKLPILHDFTGINGLGTRWHFSTKMF